MSIYNESKTARTGRYGVSVDRDSDTLPQVVSYPLFNVVGGRVAITQVIGEVTVEIEDQANDLKLQFTPTGGTVSDLCTELDITADEVGTLYSITGNPGQAMRESASVLNPQATDIIVGEGTIDINCSEESTGEIKWTIYYIAMDDGAYIEAAADYAGTTTAGA
jgi:hypothetical protein